MSPCFDRYGNAIFLEWGTRRRIHRKPLRLTSRERRRLMLVVKRRLQERSQSRESPQKVHK